jgi:hypothetical protein
MHVWHRRGGLGGSICPSAFMIAAAIASRLCIFSLQLPRYISLDDCLEEFEGKLVFSSSRVGFAGGVHVFSK